MQRLEFRLGTRQRVVYLVAAGFWLLVAMGSEWTKVFGAEAAIPDQDDSRQNGR